MQPPDDSTLTTVAIAGLLAAVAFLEFPAEIIGAKAMLPKAADTSLTAIAIAGAVVVVGLLLSLRLARQPVQQSATTRLPTPVRHAVPTGAPSVTGSTATNRSSRGPSSVMATSAANGRMRTAFERAFHACLPNANADRLEAPAPPLHSTSRPEYADRSPMPLLVEHQQPAAFTDVIPRLDTPICSCALQRWPGRLAFPVLHITANGGEYADNNDIPNCLKLWSAALKLGEPLLVVYDFSRARLPPFFLGRKLLNKCVAWADANVVEWDTNCQGIAVVLSNPLASGFFNMVMKIMSPPQPMSYCTDVDAALDFLGSVREARSYVKASYPARAQSGNARS